MDKERILAARKKLKEFQRNKKDLSRKNGNEQINSEDSGTIQIRHSNISPAIFQDDNQSYSQSDKFQNNGDQNEIQMMNVNENSSLHHNNLPQSMQENIEILNLQACESNGIIEIPSYNFTPSHSRNESNSTVSSQIIHENVDHMQNLSMQKFQNLSSELNISNNGISLLSNEPMAIPNVEAEIFINEQGSRGLTFSNNELEQKNQFLNLCLEEQKKLVNQLQFQISQSNSKIADLESIIKTKDTDLESKFVKEIHALKEQIQLNTQTIEILVAEKAELTASNSHYNLALQKKNDELTELSNKLTKSQQHEFELESELLALKKNTKDYDTTFQGLQKNYEEEIMKSSELKKKNDDLELEISELHEKLNYRSAELSNLEKELGEKVALLSLNEIRVQQLLNSSQDTGTFEAHQRTANILEQQLHQMKQALDCVSGEKDEVNKKYQSYVKQLDERHSNLMIELENSKKIISESEIREQSYIQRLSDLEQQLQKLKVSPSITSDPTNVIEDQSEKINMLTKSIDNLVLEQENFQSLLNEKDNEIELLKKELKELEGIREQNIEASKLAVALQSEQLGASRAVSQNQQLKTQLDEMHDAFISLSNTKLDLTEQLQAERTIGKKLNAKLNEVELQVSELKDALTNKESALQVFEKEKLQAAQIEDQMQHYQAQSHNAATLQYELQKALMTIENLKKENQLLQTKLDSAKDGPVEEISDVTSENTNEISVIEKDASESSVSTSSEIPNIPEAFKKLEKRFKETMDRVAELSDEKQRLEHLVLQLQGETETIGEYVTLYQKQRSILQNKAREKETTYRQIMEQRNIQQIQLHKLKMLVAELLKSKNSKSTVTVATVAEENMPISTDGISENVEVIDGHENSLESVEVKADETTSQIMDLLTEIKDCNNTCTLEPNFHPCPWCSGKLITV